MNRVSENEFDINNYLRSSKNNISSNELEPLKKSNRPSFADAKKYVVDTIHEKLEDKNMSDEARTTWQENEHKATIGEPLAQHMMIEEIRTILRDSEYELAEYNLMFDSLEHAIFEHIYRFKIFYKWNLYPDSPSAKIDGKDLLFKINGIFVKQEEEFDSLEEVEEIQRLLQKVNPKLRLSEATPEGEMDLSDGTRVTITIPPRTLTTKIVFRRFTVRDYSLEHQADLGTIDHKDIPIFRYLAKKRLNTVIAGGVESGKSTFLKSIFNERDPIHVALLIEETPESFLKRDFPNRVIHEFYTYKHAINKTMRTILRFDHDYVIFQEVRGVEADAAIDGASRGAKGLLMTYHVTEQSDICEQLAQHIVDEFPNRRFFNETRRVAKTLQLGFTMENFIDKKNRVAYKKVTSVFEIVYERATDRAYINYIMLYNSENKDWEYNSTLSTQLIESLRKGEEDEEGGWNYEQFIGALEERTLHNQISQPIVPINLREEGR